MIQGWVTQDMIDRADWASRYKRGLARTLAQMGYGNPRTGLNFFFVSCGDDRGEYRLNTVAGMLMEAAYENRFHSSGPFWFRAVRQK